MAISFLGWKVWYKGGVCYSSLDTDWSSLPTEDVLFVKLYWSDGGYRIMSGALFYFRVGELYSDIRDMWCELGDTRESAMLRYPSAEILVGRWTTDKEFEAIKIEVEVDKWQ